MSPTFGFRPLAHPDLALLGRWLAEPHVEPWWLEDHSPEGVLARYGPTIDGIDATEVFVVELDGEPLGMVQRFRLADEPEWAATLTPTLPAGTDPTRVAGLDYLIGSAERTGQGLGPRMLEAFTVATFDRYPEVDIVAVAVQEPNRRSWRALEKTGYHRVYEGEIVSDDPADAGVNVVYVRHRGPPDQVRGTAGGPPTTP